MLIRLIRLEALRRPLPLLLIGTLAFLGAGGAALALPATSYLARCANATLVGSSSENELFVLPRPPETPQGFSVSFDRPLLTQADVDFLAELPGVIDCRVLHSVPIPATGHFKRDPYFDSRQFVGVYALDPDAVPDDIRARWEQTEGPVPVLLNPSVIQLYNLGFADRYGLPRLEPEFLTENGGMEFDLQVGRDVFMVLDGWHTVRCQIVGYSADVPLWGVTIPLRVRTPWMAALSWRTTLTPSVGPMQVSLTFADVHAKAAARPTIEATGMIVDGFTDLADQVERVRGVIDIAVQGLLVLLGLIAIAATGSLAAGMIAERRRPLTLYRSVGARLPALTAIFGSGLVCAAGGGAAVGIASAHASLAIFLPSLAQQLFGSSLVIAPALAFPWWAYLAGPATAAALVIMAVTPVLIQACQRPLLDDLRGS